MNAIPTAMVELNDVAKRYRFFAMHDVSLRIEPGQILGLVGPAGAGKSTLLRLLMGMVEADAGQIRVFGHALPDAQALAKRDIGFVSQEMGLFGSATLGWHMRFVARMYPGWDDDYAADLLRRFALHAEQPCRGLSSGERIKALLLLALARRPRLLLLDEPTTGLDPVARHEVLAELMTILADERRSIVFSSHHTADVERIADRIAFLDRGRLLAVEDTGVFIDRWRRVMMDIPEGSVLPSISGLIEAQRSGHSAVLTLRDPLPGWEARLGDGVVIRDVQRMTLEEIFVATVMHDRRERAR